MEELDLVSYYKSKAKEWIFTPSIQNVAIEDDEILDLDSISLGSNEDTWLYSSSTKNSDSGYSRSIDMDTDGIEKKRYAFPELNESSNCGANDSVNSSLFSPGIIKSEDERHEWFLNSIDKMSESQYDLYCKTPVSCNKSKSNMLRKALTTPRQLTNVSENSLISAAKIDSDDVHPSEHDAFVFKKPPPRRDSSDKSCILHSVENKLFTLTDADTNDLKSVQNRDIKSAVSKHCADLNDETVDEKKDASTKSIQLTPSKRIQIEFDAFKASEMKAENNENVFKKSLPLGHSTPQVNQNGERPPSRRSVLLQPSPVLLNRYLKYNKIEDKVSRASDEFAKDEVNKDDKNEMNVSCVRYSRDSVDSTESHCSDDYYNVKSNLNTTYSKSDDVLSSPSKSHIADGHATFELTVEDDVLSSTSESSLSSVGNKHPLSILDVRKMAERQEMSLKQHIRSSNYTGSSKSSEVSSSSESISAFGTLSSSNETNVNASGYSNRLPTPTKDKSKYSHPRSAPEHQSRLNTGTYSRSGLRLNLQKKIEVRSTVPTHETKLNATFKSRVTSANGTILNNTQTVSKSQQLPRRAPSLTRQPVPQLKVDEEFVSVKEIKSRDNIEVKTTSAKSTDNSGPTSHIPRPSSRIPTLRSSVSCNRYNKDK